jgi:nitronate monooxygenase
MAAFDAPAFARHVERLRPVFAALDLDPPAFPNRFGQDFDEQVAALIDAAPPVFSFVFGIPSPAILEDCRKRGIVTIGNATTVDEARDRGSRHRHARGDRRRGGRPQGFLSASPRHRLDG